MDEKFRALERRALSGDTTATQQLRRLALSLNRIPHPVVRALAGYGYQPAQNILQRHEIPNSTSQAFDILYHEIPHNAHTAAVIRYRVLAPAYERMIRCPAHTRFQPPVDPEAPPNEYSVRQALESIDPEPWQFRLQERRPSDVIETHVQLARRLTEVDYYDDLCIRSHRDYNQTQQPGTFGNYYPKDPLVIQHKAAYQDCMAVGHLLQDARQTDLAIPQNLSMAIFSLGDALRPKIAGLDGVNSLDQMLHGVRYFLDGMDYSWSNNAHVEAIWSYYLI